MGDNSDLQALFDQASAEALAALDAAKKPQPARAEDDLEALFDQVSNAARNQESKQEKIQEKAGQQEEAAPALQQVMAVVSVAQNALDEPVGDKTQDVFHRIGHLTRTLHDALRELGYDKAVESAMHTLPDTRDRLAYIATLTGKAADRALQAVETGKVHQDRLQAGGEKLAAQWDRVFEGDADVEEFKATATATRAFLKSLPSETGATNAQLTEIMMAQDFHDLTGQVINRVVGLAREMEQHLLALLLETTPPEKRLSGDDGFLTGPVINTAGRSDVVDGQAQVDDLLESLGF
jgi:chemotaxis protein CheZ